MIDFAGKLATAARNAARDVRRGLADALLPQTCVACGRWISAARPTACDACDQEITLGLEKPYCPRCGRTLPGEALHERGCARCRTERFWNVAGVARVGLYTPAMRAVLLGLKHSGQQRNAVYLADLLARAIAARGWDTDLDALVAVPMHWLRRMQRPCDHARLLAEALGRRLRLPVLHLVRRAQHRPSQTGMRSKAERFANVKGCFAQPWGWRLSGARLWRPRLAGRTVCIVDNLITTGATVHEVSKVLRRAGAGRIYAVTVARPAAPGDPPAGYPLDAPWFATAEDVDAAVGK